MPRILARGVGPGSRRCTLDATYNRYVNYDDADPEDRNPLSELVSFPDTIVVATQEGRPSESHGWLLYYLLEMRKPIVAAHLRAQLETAGYVAAPGAGASGISHYLKDDSLIWATITDAPDARTSLLLSIAGPPSDDASFDEDASEETGG